MARQMCRRWFLHECRDGDWTDRGLTLIEVMIAMLVLCVGLLGMAGMIMLVSKGNRGATDITTATNVCQMKIEELKDIVWEDLGTYPTTDENRFKAGAEHGAMVQEGLIDPGKGLNAQQMTRTELFLEQQAVAGSPCEAPKTETDSDCKNFLNEAGPYKYARTFVICRGDENPSYPPTDSTVAAGPVGDAVRPNTEPDCRVNASENSTRSRWLTCAPEDIATTPGPSNKEKKVKVLCAWRDSRGVCSSVHLDTTLVGVQ